ncbi:Uncharacterized membrane protein YkvI [Jeotgalicoccus aerolatus]|uniref:Uncharacterized membrane protein YkvI n=1 Tax=Jeotgalicoccus aerolatus TaxID=709510 RepID=A0A1G8XMB5_9STAP|nr:hypothetical protein [Jeotgalicoccus aerolatus]NMA81288.1 hypothetical protein [Jeotgalicoccus aerolatus]SDJ91065.1 Uncharacterized membrane protein YkvI [Jeotgalicoccus aerolatus]HJG33564.1 hypothetical protein [Jeotgalicoccus aerolatus]
MKRSFQIGSAFVGLIVGAGFASGQEVMQYFTSFGMMGTIGGIVTALLFIFLGFTFARLGTNLKADSHKTVLYYIGGKYIGPILDIVITFFLFGVAVVMFAGAGSTFNQMFGISAAAGSVIMAIAVILTLLLNTNKIIGIIATITPYLIAIIFIILIYSIFTMDLSLAEADALAREETSATSNWLLSAFLYVSYNLAAGAALLIIMTGNERNKKVAGMGGILGGLMLGVLIILIHIAMLVRIDIVGGKEMPTLELASQIHPAVGLLTAIALLGMIYNTAVGMLYSFTVRFIAPESKSFRPAVIVIGILGFIASMVGFTTLVGSVYVVMGYLGFALIILAIAAWLRKPVRK